ncbi:chlorophyllase-2-like isoform X2 [Rhodamnia argentea]|uniref:Chlorophyllase-2-like isoform X2 n=1 Tax=Rhodamnia argentea TaxID=178133 RepID=A0ABM3HKA5_9MYRT|nr:chlorophyllase-2-like isoform X2 [Rhodamnia argentea]
MRISFHSQLIQHVSSQGLIVVAPQLYTCSGCDSTKEINAAAATTNWLSQGLAAVLPPLVRPNLAKLALAGHSRGGKDAFALVLGKSSTPLTLPFTALLGIDPVDGMGTWCGNIQTKPPVLTYVAQSFDLKMPVMVVGSGLGEDKKYNVLPACAPKGLNHVDFFEECRPPACHIVAKRYGHMDMLDDETNGVKGVATCMCQSGSSREPMRRLVGGVAVAFLRAYLERDDRDLMALKDTPDIAPVEITVEFRL